MCNQMFLLSNGGSKSLRQYMSRPFTIFYGLSELGAEISLYLTDELTLLQWAISLFVKWEKDERDLSIQKP